MRIVTVDCGDYRPNLKAPGLGIWKWDKKLSLKSDDGILRVGFWGCGSAFSQNQFQSNMVLIKGSTVVFVDLGSKTTMKLSEFGLSVHDIQNLIVTHSHADHIGSLEELALKRRYEAPVGMALQEGHAFPPKGDGTIFKRIGEIRRLGLCRTPLWIPKEYASVLWSESLKGGMAHSEEIDLGGPKGEMVLEHFFKIMPLTPILNKYDRLAWKLEVGEGINRIEVLMYVTPHIPDTAKDLKENFFSAGVVVDNRVLISGDTQFDPAMFEQFAKPVETIFHDCQSFEGGVHASYSTLKKLDADVKRKIYLYHCDDGMRPLGADGLMSDRNVQADGFAGFANPVPTFYEWI